MIKLMPGPRKANDGSVRACRGSHGSARQPMLRVSACSFTYTHLCWTASTASGLGQRCGPAPPAPHLYTCATPDCISQLGVVRPHTASPPLRPRATMMSSGQGGGGAGLTVGPRATGGSGFAAPGLHPRGSPPPPRLPQRPSGPPLLTVGVGVQEERELLALPAGGRGAANWRSRPFKRPPPGGQEAVSSMPPVPHAAAP